MGGGPKSSESFGYLYLGMDTNFCLYSNLRQMKNDKERVRTLEIDGIRYGWRTTHRDEFITPDKKICVDHFLAFREGTSGTELRIRFTGGVVGGWGGYTGRIDVPALGLSINLHRPGVAAALIRRALELGWSPDAPMTVEDGAALIANLPTSVLTGIAY